MEIINILWTGGWDSTYRVMELLLTENKAVRPFYIVDPERLSLADEIQAMDKIRKKIQAKYPLIAENLLPLEVVHIDTIPKDDEITGWFRQIASKTRIGPQYEWLARFAKYYSSELELCVETTPAPYTSQLALMYIQPSLRRLGEGHRCHVDGPYMEPGVELFKYFRFPIRHMTKSDMRISAERSGFIDIMKLTWFCLEPVQGLPCGQCRPCLLAPLTGITFRYYQPTVLYKVRKIVGRNLARAEKFTGRIAGRSK